MCSNVTGSGDQVSGGETEGGLTHCLTISTSLNLLLLVGKRKNKNPVINNCEHGNTANYWR